MTRVYETTSRRYVELTEVCRDPSCDEHAHCSACGEVMRYEAGRLVCDDCLTDALAEPKSWEPAQ